MAWSACGTDYVLVKMSKISLTLTKKEAITEMGPLHFPLKCKKTPGVP